jgi:hypothetical protein
MRLHCGKQLLVPGQLGVRCHVLEVVPGTKGLARTRQHHHARTVIAHQRIQRLLQRCQHVSAQGIEAGGVVQGEGDHAARVTRDVSSNSLALAEVIMCIFPERCTGPKNGRC